MKMMRIKHSVKPKPKAPPQTKEKSIEPIEEPSSNFIILRSEDEKVFEKEVTDKAEDSESVINYGNIF